MGAGFDEPVRTMKWLKQLFTRKKEDQKISAPSGGKLPPVLSEQTKSKLLRLHILTASKWRS